jgi:hypothetical protein
MAACTSGCPTPGAHSSWGECIRAKNTVVMGLESTGTGGFTANQKMHRENTAYRNAVAEGLQPQAPTYAAIDKAKKLADMAGHPISTE